MSRYFQLLISEEFAERTIGSWYNEIGHKKIEKDRASMV